jgi:hypothetical protein
VPKAPWKLTIYVLLIQTDWHLNCQLICYFLLPKMLGILFFNSIHRKACYYYILRYVRCYFPRPEISTTKNLQNGKSWLYIIVLELVLAIITETMTKITMMGGIIDYWLVHSLNLPPLFCLAKCAFNIIDKPVKIKLKTVFKMYLWNNIIHLKKKQNDIFMQTIFNWDRIVFIGFPIITCHLL